MLDCVLIMTCHCVMHLCCSTAGSSSAMTIKQLLHLNIDDDDDDGWMVGGIHRLGASPVRRTASLSPQRRTTAPASRSLSPARRRPPLSSSGQSPGRKKASVRVAEESGGAAPLTSASQFLASIQKTLSSAKEQIRCMRQGLDE